MQSNATTYNNRNKNYFLASKNDNSNVHLVYRASSKCQALRWKCFNKNRRIILFISIIDPSSSLVQVFRIHSVYNWYVRTSTAHAQVLKNHCGTKDDVDLLAVRRARAWKYLWWMRIEQKSKRGFFLLLRIMIPFFEMIRIVSNLFPFPPSLLSIFDVPEESSWRLELCALIFFL